MKLIRISGIEPESIVDGEGIRYVIFTQGCPHHCPGCHNPQTHPFGGGKLVSIEDILDNISKRKNWIDGITLSGGEPFCQIYQCALIAEKAHEMGLSVWCYTGYLFEDLYRQGIELLKHIDVLVDGPFVQAEKSLELDFRGSRNQRVIDIPESLKEGVAILKQTRPLTKPLRALSVKKTKDFIGCCIHCFTCVSWLTLRSKVGLFWLINGTDGFGDERNESVHT
jgi:anaerobic ribonucleoside-triphosphate reductase activating protein